MIALVDLGCGNLGSVAIALRRLGVEPLITADPATIAEAGKVILPGVGAAGYAAGRIDALGLRETLRSLEQPVLGICLGMQLLFERSDEDGAECLGVIPGAVRRLAPEPGVTVPHMGWSRLELRGDVPGLADGDYVYFAHSFAADPGPHAVAIAYHGREVPAVVRHRNFIGAQFHPERSGVAGTRFLSRFVEAA
jgi:imidazole glycerol-phosphate synthase subunit HisH